MVGDCDVARNKFAKSFLPLILEGFLCFCSEEELHGDVAVAAVAAAGSLLLKEREKNHLHFLPASLFTYVHNHKEKKAHLFNRKLSFSKLYSFHSFS